MFLSLQYCPIWTYELSKYLKFEIKLELYHLRCRLKSRLENEIVFDLYFEWSERSIDLIKPWFLTLIFNVSSIPKSPWSRATSKRSFSNLVIAFQKVTEHWTENGNCAESPSLAIFGRDYINYGAKEITFLPLVTKGLVQSWQHFQKYVTFFEPSIKHWKCVLDVLVKEYNCTRFIFLSTLFRELIWNGTEMAQRQCTDRASILSRGAQTPQGSGCGVRAAFFCFVNDENNVRAKRFGRVLKRKKKHKPCVSDRLTFSVFVPDSRTSLY